MSLADLRKAVAKLSLLGEEYSADVQETLDELEEKQSERETDARGEKIEKLQAVIDALEAYDEAVGALQDATATD